MVNRNAKNAWWQLKGGSMEVRRWSSACQMHLSMYSGGSHKHLKLIQMHMECTWKYNTFAHWHKPQPHRPSITRLNWCHPEPGFTTLCGRFTKGVEHVHFARETSLSKGIACYILYINYVQVTLCISLLNNHYYGSK